ncbi:MAG: 1-phosphofructokinase family hexose kinase [Chloroflexus sp.]|uniref:1-phosphofructokinase family hexose kinase n=1 Tax=Chloroflexus sp. TaxID=1904827 RepID=UPI0030B6A5B7
MIHSSPFLIITPNPAVDRILITPGLRVGQEQRVHEVLVAAGGKGLNVGRALRALGVNATIRAPLGGITGQHVSHLAQAEGLTLHGSAISNETRVCTLIVDPSHQQVTVLNEKGPRLTGAEWQTFTAAIVDDPAPWNLICGSLPPGVEPTALAELIKEIRDQGRHVLVDTSGPALAAAISAGPDVVKINSQELSHLTGIDLPDEMSVYRAAQALHRQGIARIVITLGAAGAIGIDADGAVRAIPPAIPVHNPIGCGDSFFAGLTVALSRGHSLADAVRLATACGATDAQTLEPGRIDPATVATCAAQVRLGEY